MKVIWETFNSSTKVKFSGDGKLSSLVSLRQIVSCYLRMCSNTCFSRDQGNFVNCLIDFWHLFLQAKYFSTYLWHTPKRFEKRSTLACVKLLSFTRSIMLSSIMEIYAFQLASFEISPLCSVDKDDDASGRTKGKRWRACRVIYIKKGFRCKLVIKTGAFTAS